MRKHIFSWIALVASLAVICSAPVCAGNFLIDGSVQPGEWAGASFSTLFGSAEESGCAVAYADVRTQADLSAQRVYFAFQVIDGAFTGGGGRSRVHLRLGTAEITLDADGHAQTSANSYAVQAAGQYQQGGYNGDYVVEAAITCPASLFAENIAVSLWFTDGKGGKSRIYELTVLLDLPDPSSESTLPQPDSTTEQPQSSTQADHTKQPSTQNSSTHTSTSRPSRPVETTVATTPGAHGHANPGAHPSDSSNAAAPATNANSHRNPGGQSPVREPSGGPERTLPAGGLEDAAFSSEALTIPATGEKGAGLWSTKRITACVIAGVCVIAAALLFVMRVRKKGEALEG